MRRKRPRFEPVSEGTGVPQDLVLEAIERFVRLLARMGISARELRSAVAKACERHADTFEGRKVGYTTETQAAHILTVWFSEPLYVDRQGAPLPLAAQGREPSIEALTARVGGSLRTAEVIRYLLKAKALKRQGTKYVPQRRDALFQGRGHTGRYHNLLPLLGMLSTLLHNSRPHEDARNWFEARSYNPKLPRRARAHLASQVSRLGLDFLRVLDADMHRAERAANPGEPTVHSGIGVYQYEEPVPDANEPGRGSARKGRARKHK